MRKEKIEQLVDVMQAYVNGKNIQYYKEDLSFTNEHSGVPILNNKWVDVDEEHLFRPDLYDYRIKPESQYRSFKNAEECWQEMLKHQPFGWIKRKEDVCYSMITGVDVIGEKKYVSISGDHLWSFDKTISDYTFADGTPFGMKEEH